MTTRFEDLTDEQLAEMDPAELEAMGQREFGTPAADDEAYGEDDPATLPAVEEPAPVAPAAEAAAAVDYQAQYEAAQAELQRQQEELAAIRAAVNDPQQLRAQLARLDPAAAAPVQAPAATPPVTPPSWDDDPDAALAYIIEQATAPLQAKLQTLEERDAQRQAQDQEREMMMTMAGKYGQDFEPTLREFDAGHAHLRHLPLDVRYVAARGLKALSAPAVDPVADEARILAKAEELLAQRLKGGKPLAGVPTLGGAPQAVADTGPVDLGRMSWESLQSMPMDQFLDVGRKAFGAGR